MLHLCQAFDHRLPEQVFGQSRRDGARQVDRIANGWVQVLLGYFPILVPRLPRIRPHAKKLLRAFDQLLPTLPTIIDQVSRGLQLQSLWMIPAARVSLQLQSRWIIPTAAVS